MVETLPEGKPVRKRYAGLTNDTDKKNRTIPTEKKSAAAVQADILRSQLTTNATKYGIAYYHQSYYIMYKDDVCYRISRDNFLLDFEKLKRFRVLRLDMYDELIKKARLVQKIHRRKVIHGSEYAIFALDDMPLFVPAERLNLFSWKYDRFYAIDEFSPVFVVPHSKHKPSSLGGIIGFASPVQVSGFTLKQKGN